MNLEEQENKENKFRQQEEETSLWVILFLRANIKHPSQDTKLELLNVTC